MTEPVRVGDLLPGVLGEVVDRAGHGYDRWAELVAQAGYCHHPATAITRSAWPAALSTPTGPPAKSGRCTTRSGSRTGCC